MRHGTNQTKPIASTASTVTALTGYFPRRSFHPALVARPRDGLGAALMEHGEAVPR